VHNSSDLIYLDYNATTPLDERVLAAMTPYLTHHFASPMSSHQMGAPVAAAMEQAREQVAALIGAQHAHEIVFTSGGTESNNAAIFGVAQAAPRGRDQLVSSVMEHAATSEVIKALEERGHPVTWLDIDAACQLDLNQAADVINAQTLLVSVMHANNEVGAIQPIEAISRMCTRHGALLHVDGAQAVGKLPVDVQRDGIDLYSLVGHKFYGPKGIGALYVREGVACAAQMLGAGHESGKRSGTPNVPAIVGLGKACELAREELAINQTRLRLMRDTLRLRLSQELPEVHFTCPAHLCLPHTLHVCFPDVMGADVLRVAGRVCASTGSACHKPGEPPSATLMAMGLPDELARGSVRLSLGHDVTPADLDDAAALLVAAYRRLRAEANA
jgi:cysteine desulfurase